ncbi:hypothetical protein Acr_25g0009180 [Actinidia rufa]|uniref:Uncharacterized protein n=1 Tax=Actinidia rufa TaxID=165716 RepID=A0A7J0H0B7_9ERIC|nr:hypothetical protein Acr_25g0009180 [Actinidia rufa]
MIFSKRFSTKRFGLLNWATDYIPNSQIQYIGERCGVLFRRLTALENMPAGEHKGRCRVLEKDTVVHFFLTNLVAAVEARVLLANLSSPTLLELDPDEVLNEIGNSSTESGVVWPRSSSKQFSILTPFHSGLYKCCLVGLNLAFPI